MKDFFGNTGEGCRVAGSYKQNYADNNANLALFAKNKFAKFRDRFNGISGDDCVENATREISI